MDRLIGGEVKSNKYGLGQVVSIEGTRGDYIININFRTGLKQFKLFKSAAMMAYSFTNKDLQKLIEDYCFDILAEEQERKELAREFKRKNIEGVVNPQRTLIEYWAPSGYAGWHIDGLRRGISYGTSGTMVYDKCKGPLFWRYAYRSEFTRGRLFYTEDADDNYSIWMLPHNNMTNSHSQHWINYIYNDSIEEEYIEPTMYDTSNDERITFVKNQDGEYIFAGIYKHNASRDYIKSNGCHVAVYDLIETSYNI